MRENFELLGGAPGQFASSPEVTWFYCRDCGTSIHYENTRAPAHLDFLISTLDEPGAVAPAFHVQTKEKLPWITISDGLPQFERWRAR